MRTSTGASSVFVGAAALAARPPTPSLEVLDHALQRVRPAVEHQIVAQFALVRVDLGVRRDLLGH